MNNFILINKCFTETTPESAEHGDFSDQGFIEENTQVSFRELVNLMIEHREASQSPDVLNTNVWYSTGFYTSDFRTCTEREETLHYSKDNTENAAKYWKLARIAANRKKYGYL